MGGKSSTKGSDAMVAEQKAQSVEARQKEADRQARLEKGKAAIKAAFHGGKTLGTRQAMFTVPSGTGTALPTGYSYVTTPGTAATTTTATAPRGSSSASGAYVGGKDAVQPGAGSSGTYAGSPYSSNSNSGGGYQYSGVKPTTTTGGTVATTTIRGPDGKIYHAGEQIPYTETYDTGETSGGFGDDFFNNFRQGILDYFNPQVATQYGEAKDKLTYDLARAGTGRSSVATDEAAKLAEQNRLAGADVQAKADTGAADLRTRVASEEAKAENQLYATEDPDVATNQALSAVRNISLATPDVSPLGEVFKTALVGGANALGGYRNQQTINSIKGYNPKSANKVYNT